MAADDSHRGRNRVAADAAARGIAVEFVERTDARSLEEAAQILGIRPGDIVKSLVVKRHDGTFLFAEVPGDRQISWAKLRAVVGVNKLQLPDASVAPVVAEPWKRARTYAATSPPGTSRGVKRGPFGVRRDTRSARNRRQSSRSRSHATTYQRPRAVTRWCGSARRAGPGADGGSERGSA